MTFISYLWSCRLPADELQILNFCYLLHVYFAYPETKNLTLEEIAKVFDGDDAAVARVDFQQVEKELHVESETIAISKEP